VIGGDDNDTVDDTAGLGVRVSDSQGDNTLARGKGTTLDTRVYTPPARERAEWIPPRDWGRHTFWFPWAGYSSDLGGVFGIHAESEGYGFRKDPWANKHTVRLAYATRAGALGGDYRGRFRHENSRAESGLYLRLSGLDVLHFYGFGNETVDPEDDDYYQVKHTEYIFEPSHTRPLGALDASLRVLAKYTKTNLDEDRYIASAPPYGSGDFFEAGAGAGLALDTRDAPALPSRGVFAAVNGTVFPEVGQVEETFGALDGELLLFQSLPVPATPVLALRAAGKKLWGAFPWHEAAFLGGRRSVRGLASQRFAGESSVVASAELRIPLGNVFILVPGHFGIFALGDVGRVFVDGESSDQWHTSAGGGLWMSFVDPQNLFSLTVAGSDEDTRFYLALGMAY
jgi:hypothetical protein